MAVSGWFNSWASDVVITPTVETLRLTQLAEQTRARGEQIAADLAEVDALLDELQERRVTAEGRFEELDMQLADSQERHAQLGDQVIDAERRLPEAVVRLSHDAASLRSWTCTPGCTADGACRFAAQAGGDSQR